MIIGGEAMYRWLMPLMVFGAVLQVFAQTSESIRRTAFRADTNLVLVQVTVLDHRGALVNGLGAQAFTVCDNRASERISSFSEQDVPASVGIILDMSGSMKAELAQAKSAVRSFLDTANPGDEAFLYSVSSRPDKVVGFTDGLDTLLSGVAFSAAKGSTALIDTVYSGLDAMRSAHQPRKALLVISDGMDNHSRYTKSELLDRARESDVQIYTIAINDSPAYAKAMQLQEQRQGMALLEDLAGETGGLNFIIRTPEDMNRAATAISRAIRNEYTIGYVPDNSLRDGKWHSIQVKLRSSKLKVYARAGYYAY